MVGASASSISAAENSETDYTLFVGVDLFLDHEDEQVPIRTTGRGAKRKAPAAASAAGKKKPKATPKKKIPAPAKPPPGRTRKPQAIEIDDSGDDDESIPASAPASRRGRSTRAAR